MWALPWVGGGAVSNGDQYVGGGRPSQGFITPVVPWSADAETGCGRAVHLPPAPRLSGLGTLTGGGGVHCREGYWAHGGGGPAPELPPPRSAPRLPVHWPPPPLRPASRGARFQLPALSSPRSRPHAGTEPWLPVRHLGDATGRAPGPGRAGRSGNLKGRSAGPRPGPAAAQSSPPWLRPPSSGCLSRCRAGRAAEGLGRAEGWVSAARSAPLALR